MQGNCAPALHSRRRLPWKIVKPGFNWPATGTTLPPMPATAPPTNRGSFWPQQPRTGQLSRMGAWGSGSLQACSRQPSVSPAPRGGAGLAARMCELPAIARVPGLPCEPIGVDYTCCRLPCMSICSAMTRIRVVRASAAFPLSHPCNQICGIR